MLPNAGTKWRGSVPLGSRIESIPNSSKSFLLLCSLLVMVSLDVRFAEGRIRLGSTFNSSQSSYLSSHLSALATAQNYTRVLRSSLLNTMNNEVPSRLPVWNNSPYDSSSSNSNSPLSSGSSRLVLGEPFFRPRSKCDRRIFIKNGVKRIRERGSLARFQCSYGYTLVGPTTIVCLRDRWSEPPPICVRSGCRPMRTPANGAMRLSHGGAVAVFYCLGNSQLIGGPVVYCDGAKWNSTEPTCYIEPTTSTTTTTLKPVTTEESQEGWPWPDEMVTFTPIVNSGRESVNSGEENWDNFPVDAENEITSTMDPHVAADEHPLWTDVTTVAATDFVTTESVTEGESTSSTPEPSIPERENEVTQAGRIRDDDIITVTSVASREITSISNTLKPEVTHGENELTTERMRNPQTSSPVPVEATPKTMMSPPTPPPPTTVRTRRTNPPRRVKWRTTRKDGRGRPFFTRRPRVRTTAKPRKSKTTTKTTPPPPKVTTTATTLKMVYTSTRVEEKSIRERGGGVDDAPTMTEENDYSIAIDKEFVPRDREHVAPIRPIILPDMLVNMDHSSGAPMWAILLSSFVLVALSLVAGGAILYCWRKNMGIARASPYDMDGRTLSAHDANDDFMWLGDQRESGL